MKILIQNGRVLNPASNTDALLDILIEEQTIAQIGPSLSDQDVDQTIDATDCYVMPGLIDLHVHLRDPGQTYKETLETGGKAAAKGGFTTIVAMANTTPVIDDPQKVMEVHDRSKFSSPIQILQVASVTKGMNGEELTDIQALKKAGAPALSEDGKTVANAELFRQAFTEAKKCGLPILSHCEDANIKGGGAIHDGMVAKKLGLPGIPASAEDTITARDILLAKETGGQLHVCHVSTADSVNCVRYGKENGTNVTAEVCPHHFTLCEEDIVSGDSNYKMAPPLRTKADIAALIEGLKDGTIDTISTDHAPHAPHEKTEDIGSAAFGIIGLETAVPLTISELIKPGHLTPLEMAEKMSYNPAKILGIEKGQLKVGQDADVTIIDPNSKYRINKETFVSMGRNTPFDGRQVEGCVVGTIYQGNIVYMK